MSDDEIVDDDSESETDGRPRVGRNKSRRISPVDGQQAEAEDAEEADNAEEVEDERNVRDFLLDSPTPVGALRPTGQTTTPFRLGSHQANILIDIGSRTLPSSPPKTYKAAMSGPFRAEWEEEMKAEMDQFDKLDVWKIKPDDGRPKEVISGRWVYTCGPSAEKGKVKFKARWVTRGFEQREGTFGDTYSPVADGTSRRIFLAIVTREDLTI
ncbi:FOG: Transposon-encoded proteins with TYA, reverse transcriptase, integrase domains in various combinations [Phaffia rhodozyma]|uniref:FOG: Transposon-encoded proteins with TYA, reverse transcriptase, integrase domains in various combinations n=1 Tax=Phaffia rhodozyma TaxID=264483 RepID=A0A0F7SIY1_PHARH|nr:FOG: Transposon-encoded proteins with TYA, reverse transcriptase, integrase domains in various combinations [Phaffia rhodozyma]